MTPIIITTAERPDLAPTVAEWLWSAFWRESGKPFEQLLDSARRTASLAMRIPRTFVLIDGETPVGTASLIENDLDERPELSPWLAGVFVEPDFRGKARASLLVHAVENCARGGGVTALWLHTRTAAHIYARLGWRRVEEVTAGGVPSVLMQHNL